jgi:hypothetical protein
MARHNGFTWSAYQPMRPNSIRPRASGNSSQGSNYVTSAVSISYISGMKSATRYDASDENRASFKGVSMAPDFR